MLYAHAFYSREKFWHIYDGGRYQELREKYAASILFPDLYEKTHARREYAPSILKGIWRLLYSPKKVRITAASPGVIPAE